MCSSGKYYSMLAANFVGQSQAYLVEEKAEETHVC